MRLTGLIPAHAGKTSPCLASLGRSPAHPRSRGENSASRLPSSRLPGSSPLTRGKHLQWLDSQKWSGLIPAHAGKTPGGLCQGPPDPAHPRSRGENSAIAAFCSATLGSSPLTRGKPDRAAGPGQVLGLIPAHAGKTAPVGKSRRLKAAHPRSRGENESGESCLI